MKTTIKCALSFLLTTVLILIPVSVCAADPVESLQFSPCAGYTRVWDASYPCAGDLVIPDYHGGLPVEYIWTMALKYTDITSVVIPNTVKSLASGYNFDGCRKMKSVVMSDNVSIIPKNAFSNCDVLETVDLGTGVTKIYADAFINCPKLEYIELPLGITEIRSNAFYNSAFYLEGRGLQCAYFPGSAAQWEAVTLEDRTVREHILYVTHIKDTVSDVGGVKVTADERPGAKQYTFYRQEKVNGTWTELSKVNTTDSAVFLDQTAVAGHTYRYAVTAANGPYTTRMSDPGKDLTYVPVTTTKPTTTTTKRTTTTTTTTRPTTTTTTTTTRITTTTKLTTTTTTTTTHTTTIKPTVITKKPTATAKPIITTKSTTTTTAASTVGTTTDKKSTTTVADVTLDVTADAEVTDMSTTVTFDTTTSASAETTTSASLPAATQPENAPTNSWLFLVIGILAGAAIGTVVVIIVIKKK